MVRAPPTIFIVAKRHYRSPGKIDHDWGEGDVPNRRSPIEKLDSFQAVSLDTSMRVSKHDSPNPVGGMVRLFVHPVQQLQTGCFSTMRSHSGRLVRSSGNGNVIKPASDTRCNTFVLPTPTILGKSFQIANKGK